MCVDVTCGQTQGMLLKDRKCWSYSRDNVGMMDNTVRTHSIPIRFHNQSALASPVEEKEGMEAGGRRWVRR